MSISERIAFFNFVRDIPYYIGMNNQDPDYCCSTKSIMLAKMLEGLGLKTRQIICTFDWTEAPFPQDILSLPREPGETHQFLQVFIPETNTWTDCDPTWDQKLEKAGFPIAYWDGINPTSIAVKVHQIYSPEETIALMDEFDSSVDEHLANHQDFYGAINAYLVRARSSQ